MIQKLKNRLKLAKLVVKNKMSRFFMVHCAWNLTATRGLYKGVTAVKDVSRTTI